jgi:anti-anti-sigma factor
MPRITPVWHGSCLMEGTASEGQHTLRITFQDTAETVEMRLEGRVAGPWASELDRVWGETAPRLASRKLIIDLHNVTYADSTGKRVLSSIYSQTRATFITNTPWAQFLAEEVTLNKALNAEQGE